LTDPAVSELVAKKVGQTQAAADKAAQRLYKSYLRSMREALGTANLDRKIVKGLTEHLVSAVSVHAPGAAQAE
jgi:hypothetical protein